MFGAFTTNTTRGFLCELTHGFLMIKLVRNTFFFSIKLSQFGLIMLQCCGAEIIYFRLWLRLQPQPQPYIAT